MIYALAASYGVVHSLDPPTGLDKAHHGSGLLFPSFVSRDPPPPAGGVSIRGANKLIGRYVRVVSGRVIM